jgi:hypothetical protein
MPRRLPTAKRLSESASVRSETDETIRTETTTRDEGTTFDLGPLPRRPEPQASARRRSRSGGTRRTIPAFDVLVTETADADDGAHGLGSDTVSEALGAGWGLREISSILRWALADLAVALLEVERRMMLASKDKSTGARARLPFRN